VNGRIAILGWGSLLWDERPEFRPFNEQREAWLPDGPELPLEFSRVSKSRGGALTLVIDHQHGTLCRVSYALSRRSDVQEVVRNLAEREDCPRRHIAALVCGDSLSEEARERSVIRAWGNARQLAAVVWTGLRSNFDEMCGQPFTLTSAIGHLRGLHDAGERRAHEYIDRAPEFIETRLRTALRVENWFKPKG
jgi:hypothetical protein